MKQNKLNKIEFSAGQNIESAYRDLQEYAPSYGEFNGVILYSYDTLDEVFKKVTGKTKKELYEYVKEEERKYQEQLKTHKEKIPELILYYKDKARGIIPEDKLEFWDNIVPIRLNDLYQGIELQCLLDIITILNDENKTKEDRFNNCYELFYKQGHSGTSGIIVLSGLKQLHPLGYEFVDYFNNELHKNGRK